MGDERRLTLANTTLATHVMLPVYLFAFIGIGWDYMHQPLPGLLSSPSLRYMHENVFNLRVWGAMMMAVGLMIGLAIVTLSRRLCRYALLLGCLVIALVVVVLFVGALKHEAPPTTWKWITIACAACFASERSLRAGER